MEKEDIDLKLKSSEWMRNEADKLIASHKTAKTERQRALLIPKLEALQGKLKFHLREMDELLDYDEPNNYNRGF
jgi:hypothetical protein